MPKKECTDIRGQVMFFIDNALPEEKREMLISHFETCQDCQEFLESEQDIKTKICQKLKDAYICQCDLKRLSSSIKDKINEIIKI